MKNYLACLGARKGATVAVAALVTLAVGLGAHALADDGIMVLGDPEPGIELEQGDGSSDGPQCENHGSGDQYINYGQGDDVQGGEEKPHYTDGGAPADGNATADSDGVQAEDDTLAEGDTPADGGEAAPIEGLRYLAEDGGWADAPACTPLADALGTGELASGWYAVAGGDDFFDGAHVGVGGAVEVTGEVNVILRNACLNLGEGARLHVAKGASLNVYLGCHDTPIAEVHGHGADTLIDNEGAVLLRGVGLYDSKGPAVSNRAGATLSLVDASVVNCQGDGVSAEDGATTVLDGAYVWNNGGCGVSGGEVHVAGDTVVKGNAGGNVRFGGKRIIVDRALEDGASIGVAHEAGAEGTFTYGFGSSMRGVPHFVSWMFQVDAAKYFFCDDGWPVTSPLGEAAYDRSVGYLDESGKAAKAPASQCTDISDDSFKDYGGFELGNSWYIVRKDRTFNERPNVLGDARIILCDGATVNFKKGIRCKTGKLTIYAQSTGDNMGRLKATGTDEAAGIGGGNGESNGSEIVICGGYVEATGADFGAGIGGGDKGGSGTIRILGGDVTATGGSQLEWSLDFGGAAGIGSGDAADAGGTVEISGGTVNATGGWYAAGIGSGDEADRVVAVTISGGTVNATSGGEAAGIGGGNQGGCDVTISGGNVTAKSPENISTDDGAGIGTGDAGGSGRVVISGGVVDADGDGFGAGIGSGEDSRAITVEISGGTIKARGRHGAGIGGGDKTSGGTITISGGTVEATSDYGAGVGGGRDSGTITITGGHVEAHCMRKGVAIGHGCSGKNKDIRLADHLTVHDENGVRAKAEERVSVLDTWRHAWVEPCDHAGVDVSHCGFCKTYDGFRPAGATLDPAGPVGMTVWFECPEEVRQKIGDVEVSYLNARGDEYRVEHHALGEARRDDSGRYGLFLATGPLGIADTVEVRFHVGEADTAFTYCLEDLVKKEIEVGKPSETKLLEAMMSYGQSLQSWLSLVKDPEMWNHYTTIRGEYGLDLEGARRGLEPFGGKSLAEGEGHINRAACEVRFGPLAALDLYLTPAKGEGFDSCEACMDGHAATCEVLQDGRLHVHVEGIAPADFDRPVIAKGLVGGARFEARASVLAYAAHAMGAEVKESATEREKDQNAAMKRAMAAIYQYHVRAKEAREASNG